VQRNCWRRRWPIVTIPAPPKTERWWCADITIFAAWALERNPRSWDALRASSVSQLQRVSIATSLSVAPLSLLRKVLAVGGYLYSANRGMSSLFVGRLSHGLDGDGDGDCDDIVSSQRSGRAIGIRVYLASIAPLCLHA
jgi:hypothetical protein